MRSLALLGILACLFAGAARAGVAPTSVVRCGSQSVGPGALVRHSGGGARCFLAAYREGCRAARYELEIFGIDTIAVREFRVAVSAGRCVIAVQTTFRVVPQRPRLTARGTCRTLRAAGSAVLATGCLGRGLPSTLSLTAAG